MKKLFSSMFIIFMLFTIEFLLFNVANIWFVPNLLLLFIIYIVINEHLYFSIFVAIVSGIIKDSFSFNNFSINTFSFILCVFLADTLARYLHDPDSKMYSFFIVLVTLFFNFIIHYLYMYVLIRTDFITALRYIFFPEALSTLIISIYFLTKIKKCALKLFV